MDQPARSAECCRFPQEDAARLRGLAPVADAAWRALPAAHAPLGLRVLASAPGGVAVSRRTPTGHTLDGHDQEAMSVARSLAPLHAMIGACRRDLLAWILPGAVLFADERALLAVRTTGAVAPCSGRRAAVTALRRLAAGAAGGDAALWASGHASAHQTMRLAAFGRLVGSAREGRRLVDDAERHAALSGHPSLPPGHAALRLRLEDGLAVLYALLADRPACWPGPIVVAEHP